ncbi:MAG: SRPBCC family protein, partial [Pseudomonadota bacterium]
MPKIENSLVINAPIEKVWAYLDDISNASKYSASVIEARKLTEGPTGVGTKYLYVAKFMGQNMETKGEVTAYDPPHKSAWKGVDSPFPM